MGVRHKTLWYIYSQYTPIETVEQRIRYKDDFNTDYPSYRDLHTVIEKVSKKFAQLEERLRDEVRGSPEYQVIGVGINTFVHCFVRISELE